MAYFYNRPFADFLQGLQKRKRERLLFSRNRGEPELRKKWTSGGRSLLRHGFQAHRKSAKGQFLMDHGFIQYAPRLIEPRVIGCQDMEPLPYPYPFPFPKGD
jgi:hypothetical protein